VDTMQLGGMAGLTALTMGIGQDKAAKAAAVGHETVERTMEPESGEMA